MDDTSRRDHLAPLVEAVDLTHEFALKTDWAERVLQGAAGRVLRAVDGVNFAIPRGQTFGLVGESGCGKSTVAKLAVGLLKPKRGVMRFDGGEVSELPRDGRVQIVFQDPSASLDPRWRVADIVAEPLRARGRADPSRVRRKVDALLSQVGLSSSDGSRFPHEFSGGQRQRISIARALASEPEFLVCDEPTSALDVSVQAQILNLMRDLQRELGLTYLFISHNLAVVRQMADTVGVMYLGRMVETAATEALFRAPRHPYTRMLIDAIPRVGAGHPARTPPVGDVPNPLDPPAGCAFHPRCPEAGALCVERRPEWLVLKDEPDRAASCHEAHGALSPETV